MNQVTTSNGQNGTAASRAFYRRTSAPAVDIFENAEELLIVADLPGVPNDSIDLQIESDTLTLSARRSSAQKDAPALVRELDETDFVATFRIPAGIDASGIVAETKNGTLSIRLPKAAAAKTRKIAVRPQTKGPQGQGSGGSSGQQ